MIDKEDKELRNLFKRLGLGILIIITFIAIFMIFIINKFGVHDTNIIKAINNKETFYVLIDDNKCTTCKRIKEILNEESILYKEFNTDKQAQYREFLKKISASEYDVVKPTLMYIKDGTLYSSIVEISDENVVKTFIENNKNIAK